MIGLLPQLTRYHDAPLPVERGGQRHPEYFGVCNERKRVLYSHASGPNPLNHRDDLRGQALCHESMNSLFQEALYLTSYQPSRQDQIDSFQTFDLSTLTEPPQSVKKKSKVFRPMIYLGSYYVLGGSVKEAKGVKPWNRGGDVRVGTHQHTGCDPRLQTRTP